MQVKSTQMVKTYFTWKRENKAYFKKLRVTFPQFWMLYLTYEGDSVNNSPFTPAITSAAIRNLKDRGYIITKVSEIDYRYRLTEITESGRILYEDLAADWEKWEVRFWENVDQHTYRHYR